MAKEKEKIDISFGSSNRRRLQTLAVLFFVSIVPMISLFYLLAFVSLFIPIFTIPTIGYLTWMYLVDKSPTTGSRKPILRKSEIWKCFVEYFPLTLVKTADLSSEKKYVFGYHPHGIISMGAFGCFGTDGAGFSELFPGIDIRLLTLPINFRTPFLREMLLFLGLCESSQKACQKILARGKGSAIMLVVGGAQEAMMTAPGKHDLILHQRYGFVRQAILAGAELVPCYAFGENDLYITHEFPEGSFMRKVQEGFHKHFSFSLPVFHGRGVFLRNVPLYLPFRKRVTVVVGKPIPVPKIEPGLDLVKDEKGKQIVKDVHAEYEKSLKELFDTHKNSFARDRSSSLRLIK